MPSILVVVLSVCVGVGASLAWGYYHPRPHVTCIKDQTRIEPLQPMEKPHE